MIAITQATTPVYLKSSELYRSFYENKEEDDGNNEIMIPLVNCKPDETVSSQEDLFHLCHTLRYWGVPGVSRTIVEAAFGPVDMDWNSMVEEFGSELKYIHGLSQLRQLPKDARISAAINDSYCCPSMVVEVLLKQGCPMPINVYDLAASTGRLDIIKYFYGYKERFNGIAWNENTSRVAAQKGYISCLQYLHENGCPWGARTTITAAGSGHLDCLQYAHVHGCDWNVNTTIAAAENGHLDCLIYAHEHGCAWNARTASAAAENGHLVCLQYAHEHGCVWDYGVTLFAAKYGHLDCLQYAHEHGCGWDSFVTEAAAGNGHLDCLIYAHENGCPWNGTSTKAAAENGHLACLKYAHEHGCE